MQLFADDLPEHACVRIREQWLSCEDDFLAPLGFRFRSWCALTGEMGLGKHPRDETKDDEGPLMKKIKLLDVAASKKLYRGRLLPFLRSVLTCTVLFATVFEGMKFLPESCSNLALDFLEIAFRTIGNYSERVTILELFGKQAEEIQTIDNEREQSFRLSPTCMQSSRQSIDQSPHIKTLFLSVFTAAARHQRARLC